LFNPIDIENVKKIQAAYKVQTLSAFLGESATPSRSVTNFFTPISAEEERKSLGFFEELNFVLRFCPTHPSEADLMARFANLGIGSGGNFAFDAGTLSTDLRRAIVSGMRDAWAVYSATKKLGTQGKLNSGDIFGTREHLNGNYAYRMQAAVDGIYGNSKEEAYYVGYFVDADGKPMDGNENYTLHFPPGQLPPANAFWSLTLYELPSHLLSPNPIDRYLINSPMLQKLKRGVDGGLTVYIQHESPGPAKQSNWLPAPEGSFLVVLRLYWPEADALNGRWKAPPLQRAEVEELRIAS
jgi:hypothetical protein